MVSDDMVVAIDRNRHRTTGISNSCGQLLQDLPGLAGSLAPPKLPPASSPARGETHNGDDKHQRKNDKREDFHGR